MENKPIITCHGEMDLFMKLHAIIVQQLPTEATGWKRSYGRMAQTIFIEASFVPYNPKILLGEDEWTLLGRPFFHTYWANCDIDTYKSSVKENIADWLCELKANGINDWLIITVVNDDNKVKTKLLRPSVYDKIKSDFCSKQTERCVLLSDPLKGDPRQSESWQLLLSRMRQLILVSYSENVSRFETHMRSERERRTEEGWSFHKYFLLQEELAFMLEMLGLHEDTLVQYDELDALFTQFILNHVAGVKASWITWLLQGQCSRWEGLSLSDVIDNDTRQLIRNHTVSLIQLRNYLFSRQASLLLRLQRPTEVAQRSIDFMHNCIQELQNLKIKMPAGSLECWIFLSCIEVLKTCKKGSKSGMQQYSLYTASLWDYARVKLADIGQVCGLLPALSSSDSTRHNLIEGATANSSFAKTETCEPLEQLKSALSSKEAFRKHYLELSELAMGTYKHIGRMRSARKIGKDLAEFYMKLNEAHLADGFLTDALKVYQHDKWQKLAADTQVKLAQCLKNTSNNEHKYLRCCQHIASSKCLSEDIRLYYQQQLEDENNQQTATSLVLQAEPILHVKSIQHTNKSCNVYNPICVQLCVTSDFPSAVMCQHIEVSLRASPHRYSVSSVSSDITDDTQDLYSHVTCDAYGHVISSGVKCHNASRLRTDSGSDMKVEHDVRILQSAHCLRADQVQLQPGDNHITLTAQLSERGMFSAVQSCFLIGQLQLVASLRKHNVDIEVSASEPAVSITSRTDCLWLGVPQHLELVIHTGSYHLTEHCQLKLLAPRLQIHCPEMTEMGCIVLPPTAHQQTLHYSLTVLAELADNTEQEVEFEVQILSEQIDNSSHHFTFRHPFQFSHKLHSTNSRQFIEVSMCGVGPTEFLLTGQSLHSTCPDVNLIAVGSSSKQLTVSDTNRACHIWQMHCGTAVSVNFTFTTSYQTKDDNKCLCCSYHFKLDDFKLLYSIRSEVRPTSGDSLCKAGTECLLYLSICQLDKQTDKYMTHFSVDTDDNWIVSDNKSGMCEFSENCFTTSLEVKPKQGGCLPLPFTALSKVPVTSDIRHSVAPSQIYNYSAATHVHVLPAV